jgi:octaprenyl-diphosphate synthase
VQSLAAYGHHLGMAFQIIDDRLDLAGDETLVGKSLGVDLREGKVTLPVILWLKGRPARERAESRALVEAAGRDDAARARLVRHLQLDGALAAADAAARDEAAAAQSALSSVPAGADRDLLHTLAEFVVRRAL